jgi:hypothetical protein
MLKSLLIVVGGQYSRFPLRTWAVGAIVGVVLLFLLFNVAKWTYVQSGVSETPQTQVITSSGDRNVNANTNNGIIEGNGTNASDQKAKQKP